MSAHEKIKTFLQEHKVIRNLFVIAGTMAVMGSHAMAFASDDKEADASQDLVRAVTCLSRSDAVRLARMPQSEEKQKVIDLYKDALTAYLNKNPEQIKKVAQKLDEEGNKESLMRRVQTIDPAGTASNTITINGETIPFHPQNDVRSAFANLASFKKQ